jgi:hypothetical protein
MPNLANLSSKINSLWLDAHPGAAVTCSNEPSSEKREAQADEGAIATAR